MTSLFISSVLENGGQISKGIGKKNTHIIWKEGRKKSLLKAEELKIKVVTPVWIQVCLDELQIKNESEYLPSNYLSKVNEARSQELHAFSMNLNKKRKSMNQDQSLQNCNIMNMMHKKKRLDSLQPV